MTKDEIIQAFIFLGKNIKQSTNEIDSEFDSVLQNAEQHNRWFTRDNIIQSFNGICQSFLDENLLRNWSEDYEYSEGSKTIGVIAAGNIPLVCFHDILCVLISGHKLKLKPSSEDEVLTKFVINKLIDLDDRFSDLVVVSEGKVKEIDAVIATGSNNSSRYFDYYFGKYPHIIRKSRSSVAILSGKETEEDLIKLGKDVFSYFGLGCRNVSKIYIPEDFDLQRIFKSFHQFQEIGMHNKYKNNFDYNRCIYMFNKEDIMENGLIILKEDKSLHSPLAVLHFERYNKIEEVESNLNEINDQIQCIIGRNNIPFGESQTPELQDYADGIDTMRFLSQL